MRILRKFAKSTGANVALLFGLSAIPVISAGGMAIDYMSASKAKSAIQQAADDAALAAGAAEEMTAPELEALVTKYMARNGSNEILDEITNINVVKTADDQVTLTINGNIDTKFMGLIGYNKLDIVVTAVVRRGFGNLELVLVLDNTGSMDSDNKLEALKTSATQLVGELFDKKGPSATLKIGIVPFSKYVNVGISNRSASWLDVADDSLGPPATYWNGCVGSRNYPLNVEDRDQFVKIPGIMEADTDASCPRPVIPLTDVRATIDSEINAMTASNSTYIPGGLMWGWRLLSNEAPFQEAVTYDTMSNDGYTKAIVLMTDGKNTLLPTYPLHEDDSDDATTANALTAELCQKIKNSGSNDKQRIKIYTVTFAVTDPVVKSLLQNCATDSDSFFDAADEIALADAFKTIGKSLAEIALAK